MNRCLHITVHERPEALPRHPAMSLPGRTGSISGTGFPGDPKNDPLMPKTDDPGNDPLMPKTDDPETDQLFARTDDPAYVTLAHGGGWGAVAATSCGCCSPQVCRCTGAPGTATPHPSLGPRDYSGFVTVRLDEGIESETAETLWDLAVDQKLKALQAVLELPSPGTLASSPLVMLYEQEKLTTRRLSSGDRLKSIHALESRTANTAYPPLHSLTSYWRLDLRKHPDLVEEVVAQLNGLTEVGLAYKELAATDPGMVANGSAFSEDQGYLNEAPIGIGASWARQNLLAQPFSKSLTLCDLEQGWNLGHQDLKDLKDPYNKPLVVAPLFGVNRAQDGKKPGHHGTAVLGQLAADGKRVQGIAAGIARFVVASHAADRENANADKQDNNGHVAAAITQALSPPRNEPAPLQPGDILLLEVQRGRLPVEADEADFNAIRLAAGLGIIVIEAAGNGGFNLDAFSDPHTGRSLRRGDSRVDSGAILVGAARADLPHDRAPFSNYGSRLDCFGWGEAVTTCGYGDLTGTEAKNSYTNSFSGTSSASAIIAGAAALLQCLHETLAGKRLVPQAMREILADPTTGTRQGPNVPGHIGVMPDLKAIVQDRLQLLPHVYLRRSIHDDGAPPVSTDEISSSPDIFVSSLVLTDPRSGFDERAGREHLAAPGEPIKPNAPNNIYIQLRNRGLRTGDALVQLFASPTATLITPERWIPIGRLDENQVGKIPQGDTPVVAGPILWVPPATTGTPPPAWSLLAVLTPLSERPAPLAPPWSNEPVSLPPGPPYFDWAAYRAFLRCSRVAWRNTHHAIAGSTLHFAIAGTPDRARHFDFEVIQHLPAEAEVSLSGLPVRTAPIPQRLPSALDAKLRQRLSWLCDRQEPIVLPKRRQTVICGVGLAAGAWIDVTFTVKAEGPPLTSGHRLAIRQLWRGEEVGRITWFFEPHL